MRRIALIVLVFTATTIVVAAQADPSSVEIIEAKTSDGRIVHLRPDGTWIFKLRPKNAGVTLAGFTAIDNGLSYAEVVDVIGREGEMISESSFADIKTVMYRWKTRPDSTFAGEIHIMLQNNKVISKSQFGVK